MVMDAIEAIITVKGTVVRLVPSKSCRMTSTGSFCPRSRTRASNSLAESEVSTIPFNTSISSPSYSGVSGKS